MQLAIAIRRQVVAVALFVVTAGLLAACGSSSSSSSADAQSLLKQTFSGTHKVSSGVLGLNVTLTPAGSSTLKNPISLSLNGPFQSRGNGNLPASNFTFTLNALGHHGELGLVSTGTNGYVVLQGAAYQLPKSDFQRLHSSFSASNGSAAGGLAKLGIQPLQWLTNPTTLGTENVAGTATTHIRASATVSALLDDLDTFLVKAEASGSTGSANIHVTIPPSTRAQIAKEIKHPTVDIWTGNSDKTLRKLSLNLHVPVSGQASTLLGGLSSAGLGLNFQYANLNQPQTIAAPSNVRPFSEFAARLHGVLQQVQSSFGASGVGSGATSTGSSGTSAPNSNNVQNYSRCIQQAAGDVTKMQKCASLLQSGG